MGSGCRTGLSHFSPTRRAGFSLIEVMAALVIFSVAIVSYLQATATTTAIQADLITQQKAEMLAKNVLEEIKFSGEMKTGTDSGTFDEPDDAYTWSTSIEETENTADLMEVTATIEWNTGRGDKSYSLTTLIFKQGRALQ